MKKNETYIIVNIDGKKDEIKCVEILPASIKYGAEHTITVFKSKNPKQHKIHDGIMIDEKTLYVIVGIEKKMLYCAQRELNEDGTWK